jgi:hypothetical protein
MNALLAPRQRIIWITWLIAALLFLAVGNGLIYGLIVLVLWPLLIPVGSFYNNLQSGEINLPWAAIAGFGQTRRTDMNLIPSSSGARQKPS